MTEPKKRYFISAKTFFIHNRRYRPGDVIPFNADECSGRAPVKGKKGEVLILAKPSRHMVECDHKGNPLPGEKAPVLPEPPETGDKPVTMTEVRTQAVQPAPGPKPAKRPADKDL